MGETLVQEGRGNKRRWREASNHNAGLIPLKGEERIDIDKVSEFRIVLRKMQPG